MDPAQAMLDGLVGEWRGPGTVVMPGMAAAAFDEVIRFSRRSPTSIDYWQRAVHPRTSELMHGETGIWRLGSPGRLEVSIAFPGATEIAEGAVADGVLETVSTSAARAVTSTNFRLAARRYQLRGDTLEYETRLESVHFPMSDHVSAELRRVPAMVAPTSLDLSRLIIPFADLDRTKHAEEFVGADHGEVPFSIILVHAPTGGGPAVHRHPYAEVFIVEAGEARFVLGEETRDVRAGHVVVGPPNVAHGFVNSGPGELRLIAIHGAPRFVTEWLAGADTTWASQPKDE